MNTTILLNGIVPLDVQALALYNKPVIKIKHFPGWSDVSAVYAVIVFFVYGWSSYWFIWTVPSWVYYLDLWEIFLILVYTLAVNFLESLLLLSFALVLFLIVPKKWLGGSTFGQYGSVLGLLMAAGLYFFVKSTGPQEAFSSGLLIKSLGGFLALITISLPLCRVVFISRLTLAFADRAKIFLYLTFPASVISLLVILVRLSVLR